MIDIHTHLLNEVDDGSRDIIESLTSLKLAEEAGFTDVILTPHYIENYYENNCEIIEPKIQELKKKMEDNKFNLKIHQGNEVYVTENMAELLKNGVISTLAGSKYLLFELPQRSKILTLDGLIEDIKALGCVPVLAHPERYAFVQHTPNELVKLIEKGVLMQSNYGSIIGQYGKEAQKTLIKMLKNNMVHLLGTDTHRTGYIYGHFDRVEREFLKYISEAKFEKLTTKNPMRILENNSIEIPEPKAVRKKLFFAFA